VQSKYAQHVQNERPQQVLLVEWQHQWSIRPNPLAVCP